MSEDDQPAEEIWLDAEKINAHFDSVREKYRSKSDGGMDYVPDPNDWDQNELTKELKGR